MAITDLDLRHTGAAPDANLTDEIKPCRLLALPAELREDILTLCLKSHDYDCELEDQPFPIHFTGVLIRRRRDEPYAGRPSFPALLHTCRQIRSEAVAVWFKVNRFLIYIWDLDATYLHQWTELCCNIVPPPNKRDYGSAHYPKMQIYSARHRYIWENVVQWCKWVHEGKLEPPPKDQVHYEGDHLAAGALGIAKNHRGRSWKECEESISCLWLVLEGWQHGTVN